ncbi:MAG: hypothetical protein HY077_03100 [Elusimicrobia bacterium]|nr:hypothetical protein [Elusimicrobiota bacterium]
MGDRWIDRLERRAGFIAIPGLAMFLAGMHTVVGLLSQFKEEFPGLLSLRPDLVLQGQVWRCLTFILIPPAWSPLMLLFWVLMLYTYLVRLETFWGDFRFTLYCLLGSAAASCASLLTGAALSAWPFHMSLFLSFARLDPDYEMLFFFVLPVKMRWVAGAFWFMTGWDMIFGSAPERVALAAGLANYLFFFGSSHWKDLKLAWRRSRYQGRF